MNIGKFLLISYLFVLLKIFSAIFMWCLLVAMGLRACQICPEHRINVYLSSLEPEEQV